MQEASALFRLLGDGTRLRLLRLLAQDRFNVSELTGILGVAQSGVSRHLGLLKDARLVAEEREAGYVYYRLGKDVRGNGEAPLWTLLAAQFDASAHDSAALEDDARLQEVLRHRRENFETHGDVRQLVPGRSWAAWARALGHLLPPLDVADIGCGDGHLTLEAARWARIVFGIDRSSRVLDRARALAVRRRVTNVRWKKGDLMRVPLRDGSVDVVLLSQALHHASRPEAALEEAVRVLRLGGRVLILDLRAHAQEWVRTRFGDQRLGFADVELERLLRGARLRDVRTQVGARRTGDPFTVLIASGLKPPVGAQRRPAPTTNGLNPRAATAGAPRQRMSPTAPKARHPHTAKSA